MQVSFKLLIFILLVAPCCFAQNEKQDSPITIVESSWQRARQVSPKKESVGDRPVRMMTQDDKNFRRSAREQQSKGAIDPNDYTVDARSAALEKNVQEARTVKPEDANGYSYLVKLKNESSRKVEVVFWEYRFTELANPVNVVRRQFLCAASLKPGENKDLSAFSLLGPSDVINAESLAKISGKVFDEKVLVNRIEYSDGAILQRREWKYDEVRKAVERVTSTPWNREICRGI